MGRGGDEDPFTVFPLEVLRSAADIGWPTAAVRVPGKSGIRARIGHRVWGGSTLPQVTGLALDRLKIVRVVEFMPLTSAPGRIRTCAHGSGGGGTVRR
jgi:hypothetical protein